MTEVWRFALHPRKDPTRRCMLAREWPQADRDSWHSAQREAGFLEEGGAAAGWSTTARRNAERGYGRYLTWLMTNDALDPSGDPSQRLQPPTVERFLLDLMAVNNARSVLSRAVELELFGHAVLPAQDWTWLRRVQAILRARVQCRGAKRGRIRHSNDLVRLGLSLMNDANGGDGAGTPRQRAVKFRDGLILALMACARCGGGISRRWHWSGTCAVYRRVGGC